MDAALLTSASVRAVPVPGRPVVKRDVKIGAVVEAGGELLDELQVKPDHEGRASGPSACGAGGVTPSSTARAARTCVSKDQSGGDEPSGPRSTDVVVSCVQASR